MIFNKANIIQILKDPGGRTEHNGRSIPNRKLVFKMLQALYARQTSFETETKTTVEDNGVGFNGFDAGFLSDVAERSKQYNNLTIKQAEKVAARLIKYAGQLESIALEKQQVSLSVCGYCSETGHSQQDCKKYQVREMGRKPEQLDLITTHPTPE